MDKDPRLALVKKLIERDDVVQKLRDIFLHIPVTEMAKQIGISYWRLREVIICKMTSTILGLSSGLNFGIFNRL